MVEKPDPMDWLGLTEGVLKTMALTSPSGADYFNEMMTTQAVSKHDAGIGTNIWTASDATTPFNPRYSERTFTSGSTGVSGKTATSILVDAIGADHKKEFLVEKVREAQAVRRAALKSIEHVLAIYPSLRPRGAGCVVTAKSLGPDVDDYLHEILHKVDFHRKDYGYGSHRRYSEGLRSLIRDWNTKSHDELIQDCELFIARTLDRESYMAGDEPRAPVITEVDRGANWGTW